MDLNFTEEQELLRSTVRELLERHSSIDTVRALEDDPVGYDPDLWQALADLDVLGLTLPEEHGGSEMGALESSVLYEELGRALAPTPHLVTVTVGAGMLASAGTEEQRGAWLPRIARGEAILTLAWHEPRRGVERESISLAAEPDGDGYRLTGTKIRVPFASSADAIIVLARAPDSVAALLVPTDAAGIELVQTAVLGSGAEYEVRFDDVAVGGDARIGADGWAVFEEVMVDVAIANAAYAVGGARRALEMMVRYAKEREQFGRQIGSFQGLAHPIADIATEITGAEVLAHQAAWARAERRDLGPLAAMAAYYGVDVFKRATKLGQQVYGGMGFTRDVDIQLYFRRAKELEISWYGQRTLEETIAAAELDGARGFVSFDAGV